MVPTSFILVPLLLGIPLTISGFVHPFPIPRRDASKSTVTRNLHISPEISDAIASSTHSLSLKLKEVDADAAKSQFFILFFGGSGGGAIGLAQIPKILEEVRLIRNLSQDGPSEGGETLNTNPLVSILYPKKICKKDAQKAIAKIPSAAKINAQGTSDSYFASLGYVVQNDFLLALEKAKCNPLASYALYQAVSKGSGKNVSPDDVDTRLQSYKTDKGLDQFLADLQSSVITKLSSYAALLFLLFVTFDLIIETGIQAFL